MANDANKDSATSQLAFPLAGDDKASFENFWVGDNLEVVNALKANSSGLKTTSSSTQITYLYGPNGCGKSHLVYAVMRVVAEQSRGTSYLSLYDKYVSPEMLGVVNVEGLVCIDNIDVWAGDDTKERALFTLFEQIKHAGGQLIVSAKQAPEVSGFALRDLVSRLSSGLIYPMQELSDEQRLEAIKMRANHRGLVIADEVLKYLVSRMSRDNIELFAFLDKMDKASLAEKRKITIPFLQELLSR